MTVHHNVTCAALRGNETSAACAKYKILNNNAEMNIAQAQIDFTEIYVFCQRMEKLIKNNAEKSKTEIKACLRL
jgi:hypothetical protein